MSRPCPARGAPASAGGAGSAAMPAIGEKRRNPDESDSGEDVESLSGLEVDGAIAAALRGRLGAELARDATALLRKLVQMKHNIAASIHGGPGSALREALKHGNISVVRYGAAAFQALMTPNGVLGPRAVLKAVGLNELADTLERHKGDARVVASICEGIADSPDLHKLLCKPECRPLLGAIAQVLKSMIHVKAVTRGALLALAPLLEHGGLGLDDTPGLHGALQAAAESTLPVALIATLQAHGDDVAVNLNALKSIAALLRIGPTVAARFLTLGACEAVPAAMRTCAGDNAVAAAGSLAIQGLSCNPATHAALHAAGAPAALVDCLQSAARGNRMPGAFKAVAHMAADPACRGALLELGAPVHVVDALARELKTGCTGQTLDDAVSALKALSKFLESRMALRAVDGFPAIFASKALQELTFASSGWPLNLARLWNVCSLWKLLRDADTVRSLTTDFRERLADTCIRVLKSSEGSPPSATSVGKSLSLLTCLGAPALVARRKEGSLREVVGALTERNGEVKIVCDAAALIAAVASEASRGEHALELVQCGAGTALVSAAKRHDTDSYVISAVAAALAALSLCPASSFQLRLSGAVMPLLALPYSDFGRAAPECSAAAVKALAAFAAHPHNRAQLLDDGAVESVLAAAAARMDNASVCTAALDAWASLGLSRSAVDVASPADKGAPVHSSAASAVVRRAMAQAPTAAQRQSVVVADVMARVLAIHHRHGITAAVAAKSCSVLSHLVLTGPAAAANKHADKMMQVARSTLAEFKDSLQAQSSASQLLCLLTYAHAEVAPAGPAISASAMAAASNELALFVRADWQQIDNAAVLFAAARGDAAVIRGINSPRTARAVQWNVALQLAADAGHAACIDAILEQLHSRDACDVDTALCAAAARGRGDAAARLLWLWKADSAADGNAAFWLAAERCDDHVLRMLVAHGNALDGVSSAPLAFRLFPRSARKHQLSLLERLLHSHARVQEGWLASATAAVAAAAAATAAGAGEGELVAAGHSTAAGGCSASESRRCRVATAQTMLVDSFADVAQASILSLAAAACGGHIAILQALLDDPRVDPQAFAEQSGDPTGGPLKLCDLPVSSVRLLLGQHAVLRICIQPAGADAPDPVSSSSAVAAVVAQAGGTTAVSDSAWRRRRAALLARAAGLW